MDGINLFTNCLRKSSHYLVMMNEWMNEAFIYSRIKLHKNLMKWKSKNHVKMDQIRVK